MSTRALLVGLAATCILVAGVTETRAQSTRIGGPERQIALEPSQADDAAVPPLRLAAAVRQAVPSLEQTPRLERPQPAPRLRPSSLAMGSLYVSAGVLQALDVHSTITGLRNGAVEANPMMKGLVKNRAAFIATKAAVGFSTIMAAREVSKRNKVAAIVTLVALNSLYGAVVHHNYQVARRLR